MSDGESQVAELVVEEEKPRRKRRTKAEMALAAGTEIIPAAADPDGPAAYEVEAKELLGKLAHAVIETQEEMNEAGDIKRAAFEKQKKLEAKRKDMKAPALEMGRKIDNEFKPALGYCQAIQDACERLIVAFRQAAAAKQDEALKAIAESGGKLADEDTLVVAHGAKVLELPSNVREVSTYTWKLTDAGAVKEAFWHRVLNTALIDALVKEKGFAAQEDVGGILIEREISLVNKPSAR
jgi:hypothetical protein